MSSYSVRTRSGKLFPPTYQISCATEYLGVVGTIPGRLRYGHELPSVAGVRLDGVFATPGAITPTRSSRSGRFKESIGGRELEVGCDDVVSLPPITNEHLTCNLNCFAEGACIFGLLIPQLNSKVVLFGPRR